MYENIRLTTPNLLGLSLLDFVPNFAFLMGGFFLVKLARLYDKRFTFISMLCGTLLVFVGGLTKAIWKLINTLGYGDIIVLGEAQFLLLAPGFLLMFLSVIWIYQQERKKTGTIALSIAIWKIPLLVIMTFGSLGMQGLLSYLAFRRKIYISSIMFMAALLCTLGLAGMASGEQTVARQWVEESINSLGQITFALASFFLYSRFNADRDARKVVPLA